MKSRPPAASKWQLFEALASKEGLSARSSISPRGGSGPLPLSFSQERMWFLEQFGLHGHFHIVESVRIRGRLDEGLLSRSLEEVVRRHQVLRTRYFSHEGTPSQEVMSEWAFEVPRVDLEGLSPEEQKERARTWAAEESVRPFDLQTEPTFRARLLKFSAEEYVLLLVMHHISSDGWSLSVFWREVSEIYTSLESGGPADVLVPPPIQYSDFAIWQRDWLQGEELERHLAFWREELSGVARSPTPVGPPAPGGSGSPGCNRADAGSRGFNGTPEGIEPGPGSDAVHDDDGCASSSSQPGKRPGRFWDWGAGATGIVRRSRTWSVSL